MEDPLSKLPMVRICTICLNVNNDEWGKLSPGVKDEVKKEMETIQIKRKEEERSKEHVAFGDGYCNYHVNALYQSYGIDPSKVKPSDIPCLVENTPEASALRHAYMRGLFTPEQMKQALQAQQGDNNQITERLQVLAGIRKFHA